MGRTGFGSEATEATGTGTARPQRHEVTKRAHCHAPLQPPSDAVHLGDDADVGDVLLGDCLEVERLAR